VVLFGGGAAKNRKIKRKRKKNNISLPNDLIKANRPIPANKDATVPPNIFHP